MSPVQRAARRRAALRGLSLEIAMRRIEREIAAGNHSALIEPRLGPSAVRIESGAESQHSDSI